MSWSVTISGKKDAAKQQATADSDRNITNGYQTEAQKALVLAAIDALPGTHVAGSLGGHNNQDATASLTGCTINIAVSSYTEAEVAA
jgi:hypothetical protein